MQYATLIEADFSLTDSEYPTFEKSGGELTLKFEDNIGERVEVYFGETIAFNWQECIHLLENEKVNSCYVIENSGWLRDHINQNIIYDGEGYNHYKFNFGDLGQLEVLSIGFQKKT
ncbi:hypothetical protein HII17_00505 [Thalassotalea sp. M1531]|uniref:Uncharacterized protein n=1 Tax=Thalassotalea algicola TaxID=2716224 RepID=A0A7Y0L8Z0_9GAMM|nr:hypothetical protein [Thalassotalea algicola]NMP30026.1 hypothetical protein [Thalassotalea algicola]